MQSFKNFIQEQTRFSNWVKPDLDALKLEYKVEYQKKPGLQSETNNAFPTERDFLQAARDAKVVEVDKNFDRKIANRSNTGSKEALLSLIRGYASYPKYRNEDTIDALYNGFETNAPMKMPIVLQMPDGGYRVMGGNTRMDVAFQLGIKPKVLLIKTK